MFCKVGDRMVSAFQKHLNSLREVDDIKNAISDFADQIKDLWNDQEALQSTYFQKMNSVRTIFLSYYFQ